VRKGFFAKDEFRYDPARDVFFCPAGETLAPRHQGKLRDLKRSRSVFTQPGYQGIRDSSSREIRD
jgi:hypothetical protein